MNNTHERHLVPKHAAEAVAYTEEKARRIQQTLDAIGTTAVAQHSKSPAESADAALAEWARGRTTSLTEAGLMKGFTGAVKDFVDDRLETSAGIMIGEHGKIRPETNGGYSEQAMRAVGSARTAVSELLRVSVMPEIEPDRRFAIERRLGGPGTIRFPDGTSEDGFGTDLDSTWAQNKIIAFLGAEPIQDAPVLEEKEAQARGVRSETRLLGTEIPGIALRHEQFIELPGANGHVYGGNELGVELTIVRTDIEQPAEKVYEEHVGRHRAA